MSLILLCPFAGQPRLTSRVETGPHFGNGFSACPLTIKPKPQGCKMCYVVYKVKIPRRFSYLLTLSLLKHILKFQLVCIFQRSWFQTGSIRVPSLPLLDRFSKSDGSFLRLSLLHEDVNSSLDDRVHSAEKQAMDGSEMGITSKRSHGLTLSEKKTLVAKRHDKVGK